MPKINKTFEKQLVINFCSSLTATNLGPEDMPAEVGRFNSVHAQGNAPPQLQWGCCACSPQPKNKARPEITHAVE